MWSYGPCPKFQHGVEKTWLWRVTPSQCHWQSHFLNGLVKIKNVATRTPNLTPRFCAKTQQTLSTTHCLWHSSTWCQMTGEITPARFTPIREQWLAKLLLKYKVSIFVTSFFIVIFFPFLNVLDLSTDCLNTSKHSINNSYAECCFFGVYPSGLIHWFQGNDNWTDSASTQIDKDQRGLVNVCSTLDVKKSKERSQPYNCSLWIPSAGKYLSHQIIIHPQPVSSGSISRVQVILIMVVIMMAKLIT